MKDHQAAALREATLRAYWKTDEGKALMTRLFDGARGRPLRAENAPPASEAARK